MRCEAPHRPHLGEGRVGIADRVYGRIYVAGDGEVPGPAEMTLEGGGEQGIARPREG